MRCAGRVARKRTSAGVLAQGDRQRMMEQFFGLRPGDLKLSRLLGAIIVPKSAESAESAGRTDLKPYAEPICE